MGRQDPWVHAYQDAPMALADELMGEVGCWSSPYGEEAVEACPVQHLFPISTDILQEKVPEGDGLCPLGLQLRQGRSHLLLIFVIRRLGRKGDFPYWKAQGFGLAANNATA